MRTRWSGGQRRIFSGRMPAVAVVTVIVLALGSHATCWCHAESRSLHSPELRAISSIADAGGSPVKVRGAVTLDGPNSIIIQDESGAAEVRPTKSSDAVSIGDEVEVVGTSLRAEPPALEGSITRLWSGSAPLPVVISPDSAADGRDELALVSISGHLVEARHQANGSLELTMQGEHQYFTAYLSHADVTNEQWPENAMLRHALAPRSTLALTGVLGAMPQLGSAEGSFNLVLRSSNDIIRVSGPPWWTPVHLTGIFLALACLVLTAVALHIQSLRLRFRAVTEERLRIARDLHDTTAQGYAGIALHLQAATQTLAGDADVTKRHLDTALTMVRHSRSESHRSIQMLRALSVGNSLTTMLKQAARQAGEGASVKIEVVVQGQEPDLPYDVAIHIYRIGQEAIGNAVQHASASAIWLLLDFRNPEIALSVRDDGCGFDAAKIEANGEHFGLVGMQERVEGLRGDFRLHSSVEGSVVSVTIPLANFAKPRLRKDSL